MLLTVVVVVAVGTSCSGSAPDRAPGAIALPSDGWRPGQPALLALVNGPFHAEMTADGPCAWIGDTKRPFLWPDGYAVRFDPTELIAPEGQVVAREGDIISAGGGGHPAPPGTKCAAVDEWTFSVMGSVG